MTESEIQCLKDNIDKVVEIETIDGELLLAKVISVFHDNQNEEHELFYELISSNKPEASRKLDDHGGYALDFGSIFSVTPGAAS